MAQLAQRLAFERDVMLAWHVAAFTRGKELKSLKTVLRSLRGHQRQTLEEQQQVVQILSNQLGIPLQRRRRAA